MSSAGASFAAAGNSGPVSYAEIKNKNEIIYANLTSDGSVSAVYTVNRFEVTKAGSITDHGDYSSVVNLTDTGTLIRQDDSVSFEAQKGNFYYQGNMGSPDLPWTFDISYYMDGVKTPPEELAGRSGKLDIHIVTAKNSAADPVFYDHFMLQISMTLDSDKCGDIESQGASIAGAGKNMIITHTVMPGKDADITLSASVKDFEMGGIEIAAVPFSMNVDLPDTDDMTDDFTALSDAISGLDEGVVDLLDGIGELKSGSNRLKNGSSDIRQGLEQLSGNSDSLISASGKINGALSKIASSLNSGAGGGAGDIAQLPQALKQLAQGLRDLTSGLADLKNGFAPAYAALDSAMNDIPSSSIDPSDIAALYTGDAGHDAVITQLIDSYQAAQTAKGTYNSVKGAFDAIVPAIDTMSGSVDTIAGALTQMSEEIGPAMSDFTAQMKQLANGLSQLSDNYGDFHNGLAEFMGGLSDLTNGYKDFDSGVSAFSRGIKNLYDGVEELQDGTGKLADETDDMPETVQAKIDDLLDEYTGTDFELISFTSPLNENISLVQFVIKCGGIAKQDEEVTKAAEPQSLSIWDRFIALFRSKEE
jgi:X-X-X-Leu-X-X-Gly heptad repeat protein